LGQAIASFVNYYNLERYHDSLDDLTPHEIYFGKAKVVKDKREEIKRTTVKQRRRVNRQTAPNTLSLECRTLS
jgi:hypothetical protein